MPPSVAQGCRAARSGNTSAPFRRPTVYLSTLGEHFCTYPSPDGAAPHTRGTLLPHSVAQRGITTRSGDISAPFRRLTAPRRTPGRHLRPIPSPSGAAAHTRGTLLPRSVAQRCRVARSGNISATIRRPTVPRRTLREHFRPFPSPKGAAPHARATLTLVSVAQRCRIARSGNTSARFRSPRVPRRTLGEHFCPIPSPNGVSQHTRGTFLHLSVARWCRVARPGDTYARFRRRGGRGKGNGRGWRSMGDGREAGLGRSLGGGWTGGWTGGWKRQRDRHGHGDGDKSSRR